MAWKVTLYNTYAQCGIAGPVARTMDQAFRKAKERARDEFLYYRGEHARDFPIDMYNLHWPHCIVHMLRNRACTRFSVTDSARAYTIEIERAQ